MKALVDIIFLSFMKIGHPILHKHVICLILWITIGGVYREANFGYQWLVLVTTICVVEDDKIVVKVKNYLSNESEVFHQHIML